MKPNKTARFPAGLRRWATGLGVTALLILLSGTSREANALMPFPVGAADHALSATEPPPSLFLASFSMDIRGPLAAGAVDLQSRSPITPVAPSPSSGLLFVTALLGMLGVAVHGRTVVRQASCPQKPDPCRPPSTRSVAVLSPDPVVAGDIEEQLRRAGYHARIATAPQQLLGVSNSASPALVLIDCRTPDWEMLRTDPALRYVQLLGVVPLDTVYPDQQCIADLERGLDGVHDLRDGHGLLVAKVGAYLRRMGSHPILRGVYRVGTIEYDGDTREVTIAGQPVRLSAKPLAILAALMREPAKVFTRSELTDLLWGPNFAVDGHALDVHVHTLRRQLNRDPDRLCRLITIKRVGFKLKSVVPAASAPARRLHRSVQSTPSPRALSRRPSGSASRHITSRKRRTRSDLPLPSLTNSALVSACG